MENLDTDNRTTLEKSGDWVRNNEYQVKDRNFRIRHESTSQYIIKSAAFILLTGFLFYTGFRMYKSGHKSIDNWIDKMSEYFPIEK